MASLVAYALIALALLGALNGIYQKGYSSGSKDVRLKWEQAVRDQQEKDAKQAATASTKLEATREKTRTVYRTITQQVDKIVEKPVYRSVCLDADGLFAANAALSGATQPAREPVRPMPAPGPNDGRNSPNSPPKDR